MTLTVPWEEMDALIASEIADYRSINSGIHIALLGTTRGGKTTLATGGGNPDRSILRHFEDVLVLDTTGDPGAISDYGKPLAKVGGIHGHRRLTVADMSPKSKEKVYRAIQKAVRQKHVAIYADELRQLTDKKFFGLGPVFDHLWLFTAKQGISLIGGSQAPRWLSSAFYEQSKVHIIFGIRDKRARDRLGEISGDADTLKAIVPALARYEFAHVGIDGDVTISKFALKPARKVAAVKREKPPEKRIEIRRDLTRQTI